MMSSSNKKKNEVALNVLVPKIVITGAPHSADDIATKKRVARFNTPENHVPSIKITEQPRSADNIVTKKRVVKFNTPENEVPTIILTEPPHSADDITTKKREGKFNTPPNTYMNKPSVSKPPKKPTCFEFPPIPKTRSADEITTNKREMQSTAPQNIETNKLTVSRPPKKTSHVSTFSPMPGQKRLDRSPLVSPIYKYCATDVDHLTDRNQLEIRPVDILDETLTDPSLNNSFLNERLGIQSILKSIKMERWLGAFENEGIDFQKFLSLDRTGLIKIGIKERYEQWKILQSVAEYNK